MPKFGTFLLALLSYLSASHACEIDRTIKFGDLDWDSNAFHTQLAAYIIQEGYGCKTEFIPGSTVPLINGLAKGSIDVLMEIWMDNVTEPWNKAVKMGKVEAIGINFPDAQQGWYVPRYLVEGDAKRGIKPKAPDLRHVDDLPKYKKLFRDPEEPSKGRFYNCKSGWECEVRNAARLKAYGLDEHFVNFRTGSGGALEAVMVSGSKRGKPFLAYYWTPTRLMATLDLLKLEEPPYDKEKWQALPDNPIRDNATGFPVVPVYVGVNLEFKAQAPALIEFLTKYETSNSIILEALAYMDEPGRSVKDAALNFLKTRGDIWEQWLPADIAEKVKTSL